MGSKSYCQGVNSGPAVNLSPPTAAVQAVPNILDSSENNQVVCIQLDGYRSLAEPGSGSKEQEMLTKPFYCRLKNVEDLQIITWQSSAGKPDSNPSSAISLVGSSGQVTHPLILSLPI